MIYCPSFHCQRYKMSLLLLLPFPTFSRSDGWSSWLPKVEEVVGVSQEDVFLLMGENIQTVLLRVLHVHHDVAEDAERGDIAFDQHDGVALRISVPQPTMQRTNERKDLHKGLYQHRSHTCQIHGCCSFFNRLMCYTQNVLL